MYFLWVKGSNDSFGVFFLNPMTPRPPGGDYVIYIVTFHAYWNSPLSYLTTRIITPVSLVLFMLVAGVDTPIFDRVCMATFTIYMRLVFIKSTLTLVHEVSRCGRINSRIPFTLLKKWKFKHMPFWLYGAGL